MSVIPKEEILTPVEEAGKASIDAAGTFGASWRVMLFRAVRDGDVPLLIRVVQSHPTSIHENFTNGMKEWELSWDSLRWYEFADATALYLASAYSRVEVVKFLLKNGVDPDAVCYSKQIGKHTKRVNSLRAATRILSKLKSQPTFLVQLTASRPFTRSLSSSHLALRARNSKRRDRTMQIQSDGCDGD